MSVYRLKGTAGQVTNKAWPLEQKVVIGSDTGCDIHVESESIAPRHAELEVGEGSISIRALADDAALFLNGAEIRTASLGSGDEIRIGTCRWLLQAPGLRPQKVLTEEAVRRRVNLMPWLIAGGLSALGLLAWWLGYLPF
ncbi:MAG TPA: FHA domain-containing protein [Xanthomonadales bacterium]|nr:FHA domain-containing protein [Xanthomonadales bacterium]